MLTLENKNFFGNQGQGYLLTAIASVLIGGTSIFGGRATIVGTVFGCFIIGMIEAGLVATGLTGAWVRTVQGLIFLIADHLLPLRRRAAAPQRALRARCAVPTRFGRDTTRPNSGAGSPDGAARSCKGGTNMKIGTDSAGRRRRAWRSWRRHRRVGRRADRQGRRRCTCRWAAMPATARRSPARPAPPQAAKALGVDSSRRSSRPGRRRP